MRGEVLFDRFDRGRYATDASFWIVTPRGAGSSQCGQTVNDGIVIDFSKHLNRIVSLDLDNHTCVVEPGIVLDDLNRQLKPHGLWFPVDISTASASRAG